MVVLIEEFYCNSYVCGTRPWCCESAYINVCSYTSIRALHTYVAEVAHVGFAQKGDLTEIYEPIGDLRGNSLFHTMSETKLS